MSLFAALWLATLSLLEGQSPYALRAGREAGWGALALGLGGVSLQLERKIQPLAPSDIERLMGETNLGRWDKWTVGNVSPSAQKWSDILLYGSHAMPLAIFASTPVYRKNPLPVAVMVAQVGLLNTATTTLVKHSVRRPRPYVLNPSISPERKMTVQAQESFYSGHTSQSAAMCFLSAHLFASAYPASRWKPLVWTAAAGIPALTGYLRVRSGQHYLSDVLVGYTAGALTGWLIPRLHRN
ncbi:MAG: hypothetical protein RLY31_1727 [Bacteroidota bacterium]